MTQRSSSKWQDLVSWAVLCQAGSNLGHMSPHLSMPHPWKCPVPRWMGSWAPCSNGRCPCPWQKGWNWMFLKVLSLNHLTLKLFFSYRMVLPCTCSWGCWAPLQAELPCSGCCCHQCPCSSLARGGVSVLQPAIVGNAPQSLEGEHLLRTRQLQWCGGWKEQVGTKDVLRWE